MRLYKSTKNGVTIMRLAGVVSIRDMESVLDYTRGIGGEITGYSIIDFEGVSHINYRAFQLLEGETEHRGRIIFSGLNDYILQIYSFVSRPESVQIFKDWQAALEFLSMERGKIIESVPGLVAK
ncbi:MAG: hypothetical protein B6D63_05005 [Candidatus Latescibacteria bacterium 4484_7]|nr:MAG: hypothetical protein B6D63_05005 [Candidatus Latescibacteria bacterium 4484_7]RKZ05266.1 MAG: hypothetical protein DRQ05_06740 [bacterium]